ncbi:ER membrane protein complex subunit 1-like [Antedon mediterranea]|uniref:ER membrane protein complex subunit 1-like n=1 Tax=Antedon mediterranea TaxID=105859 RepID=UPI003AF73844
MAAYILRTFSVIFLVLFTKYWVVDCLYEDEVGKYDWRQRHVGKLKYVQFEPSSGKKSVFVATESNVLAAINTRTGDLTWRQIFTRGSTGVIDALHYKNEDLITVSGGGSKVHSWAVSTGFVRWESTIAEPKQSWTVSVICSQENDNLLAVLVDNSLHVLSTKTGEERWTAKLSTDGNVQYKWMSQHNDEVVIVGLVESSHYTVQFYSLQDGTLSNENSFPAAWATVQSACIILRNGHMVCFDSTNRELQVANLREGNVFQTTPLSVLTSEDHKFDITQLELRAAADDLPIVILKLASDNQLLVSIEGDVKVIRQFTKETTIGAGDLPDDKIITTVTQVKESEVEIRCFNTVDGTEIENMKQKVDIEKNHGSPEKVSVYLFHKKDQQLSYRVLLETADDAVTMIQQSGGRVIWCREEGLAHVAVVQMVDLPVSDTEAKFEDEFGGKLQISVLEMFVRRLNTQFDQIKSYVAHLQRRLKHGSHQDRKTEPSRVVVNHDDDEEYLTRDEFNLHKMIIVVSKSGKVYGIDSTDGSIFWSLFFPNLDVFQDGDQSKIALFIQRTTAHFPNPPQCTIVGRYKTSGMTFIHSFNPITGKPSQLFEEHPYGKELKFKLKQLSIVGIMDSDFLKPILLLDDTNKVHLYPTSSFNIIKENIGSVFMFTAEKETASMSGLTLVITANKKIEAQEIWRIKLPPTSKRITGIYAKRATEEVHSLGRVLGDRTVLYKYLNPNLVVVTTEGSDAASKARLSVFLVDVVNGAIVFSMDHKRVEGPLYVVHSENWITYQYWNSKHRRAEITALELYEGKIQKNSTAFSSLDAIDSPLVERQSYILPSLVQAMAVSHTEKGITNKNIILSLQSGGLVVIPKRLLDPRRPTVPLPEHREEGLIPYLPEIPLPYLSFINYNQSVFGVEGIHTSPAGLESTCLVLAYGLDYYYTRISPSKLFDVLNQDFDYLLIATVVVGLVVAAVITKKLAAIKSLNQAWR